MAETKKAKTDKLWTCFVCMESVPDDGETIVFPKNCVHHVCHICAERWKEQNRGKYLCGICRAGSKDFRHDPEFQSLMFQLTKKKGDEKPSFWACPRCKCLIPDKGSISVPQNCAHHACELCIKSEMKEDEIGVYVCWICETLSAESTIDKQFERAVIALLDKEQELQGKAHTHILCTRKISRQKEKRAKLQEEVEERGKKIVQLTEKWKEEQKTLRDRLVIREIEMGELRGELHHTEFNLATTQGLLASAREQADRMKRDLQTEKQARQKYEEAFKVCSAAFSKVSGTSFNFETFQFREGDRDAVPYFSKPVETEKHPSKSVRISYFGTIDMTLLRVDDLNSCPHVDPKFFQKIGLYQCAIKTCFKPASGIRLCIRSGCDPQTIPIRYVISLCSDCQFDSPAFKKIELVNGTATLQLMLEDCLCGTRPPDEGHRDIKKILHDRMPKKVINF